MKINRDNYEAYFLDYHEGRLSPDMSQEVIDFVELNPDLKTLFFEFEEITLQSEQEIVFENKSELKKNQVIATTFVNENNYEELLINETEGLLSKEQISMLDEFIGINPHLQVDRELYSKTHLVKDDSLLFVNKESLKRTAISVGTITAGNFETYMARDLEGDLSQSEKHDFTEFIKYNPHLEKDLSQYNQTILKPDLTIVFEAKSSLKHSVFSIPRFVYFGLSAAASLAIIMSVYLKLDQHDIPKSVADKNQVKHKVEQAESTVISGEQIASNTDKTSSGITQNPANTISLAFNSADNPVQANQSSNPDELRQLQIIEPLPTRKANSVLSESFVDPQFTFIRVSQMYSNHHLELYYNLKLAEDIQYAQLNTKDANPTKTILNQFKQKGGNLFASRNQDIPKVENKNFSMWTLAELGVQTLNTVTSSQMELKLKKDDEGKVIGYDLESGLIEIDKDFKK